MKYPKIGEDVMYLGKYASSVPEDAKFPQGKVVRRSFANETITVQFEDGLYADWPLEDTVTVEHAKKFAAEAQKVLDEWKKKN